MKNEKEMKKFKKEPLYIRYLWATFNISSKIHLLRAI